MNQKICSKCRSTKSLRDFGKLKRSPDGLNTICKSCAREYNAQYRALNPEKIKDICSKWRKHNLDLANERSRSWREKNPGRQRAAEAAYRKNNPDKRYVSRLAYVKSNQEKLSAYRKIYAVKKRHILNANAARRRFSKRLALPSWADKSKIEKIYEEASSLSKSTGIEYHVDHIVPLQSKIVCGLHCESNLRIIRGVDNLSKGNRFWPNMP